MVTPVRFIHIEKCGGTSVAKFLNDNNFDFLMGKNFKKNKKHSHAAMFEHEDSFKFTVVRNPYTRLISFYNYNKNKIGNCTFEEFVKNKLTENLITLQVMKIHKPIENAVFGPMSIRELEKQFHWDKMLVDKIFKLENLQELKQYLKIDAEFPIENKSIKANPESYYNYELKEIVADHFKKDFEILGYNSEL